MSDLSFYIDDHALMFAWLARAVMQGEKEHGLDLVEAWVTTYGLERGERSARRCINDEQDLSVHNFFVYSEWHDERGWNRNQVASFAPYLFYTTECGWYKSWKEHDLLEYGKLYCRWIDYALVEGFNPELRLEVLGTLSAGDGKCSFLWSGQALSAADFQDIAARRAALTPRVARDFLYHVAHRYDALKRVLLPHLGLGEANGIIAQGLDEYSRFFGEEKTKALLAASKQSFSAV